MLIYLWAAETINETRVPLACLASHSLVFDVKADVAVSEHEAKAYGSTFLRGQWCQRASLQHLQRFKLIQHPGTDASC